MEIGNLSENVSPGIVVAVSRGTEHKFSKPVRKSIKLLAGLGVEGDAHLGMTVKHRSRVARDPTQPNLRQAHLIHEELFDELRAKGFRVGPGLLGENITTRGIDLLTLPRGVRLRIGRTAIVLVTGLRDPCRQLNDYQAGLMAAVLDKDEHGHLHRKAGIMGIVLASGEVRPGDSIAAELPRDCSQSLEPV
jgi:hypothetical protein